MEYRFDEWFDEWGRRGTVFSGGTILDTPPPPSPYAQNKKGLINADK